jgi:hypothetical protein
VGVGRFPAKALTKLNRVGLTPLTSTTNEGVAKLVTAAVFKTASDQDCGFDSRRPHHHLNRKMRLASSSVRLIGR